MEVADGDVSLKVGNMTQEERWLVQWKAAMYFMAANKCRPSKYNHEERNSWNWFRHTQKQSDTGTLKQERVVLFQKLLELGEKYWRVNQWVL